MPPDLLVYIEFGKAYRGYMSQGLAQIKGEYSYTTKMGTNNSVPHLRFLAEAPSPEPEVEYVSPEKKKGLRLMR